MLTDLVSDCSMLGKPNAKLYSEVMADPELCTIYVQKMLIGIHLALERTLTTEVVTCEGSSYLFCGTTVNEGLTEIMLRDTHLSLRDSSAVGVTTDYVRRIRILLTLLRLNYIDKKTKLFNQLLTGREIRIAEIYLIGDMRVLDTSFIISQWAEFEEVLHDPAHVLRRLPIGKLRKPKLTKGDMCRKSSEMEDAILSTQQLTEAVDEYMMAPAFEAINGPIYKLMQSLLLRDHPTLAHMTIKDAEEILVCKQTIKKSIKAEELIDFMYV